MSAELATTAGRDVLAFVNNPDPDALQAVLASGDISKLSASQRLQFLAAMCRSIGLNPLTQPFEFVSLSGKLRIYAKKDCTEQLRKIHDVSVEILSRDWVDDVYVVTARARMANGRQDESVGAVTAKGKRGDDLANAIMKAETKAKRRVTLSICGLGFLDESEVEASKGQRHSEIGAVHDPAAPLPPVEAAIEAEVVEESQLSDRWQDYYPKGWQRHCNPKSAAELMQAIAREGDKPWLIARLALSVEKMRGEKGLEWSDIGAEIDAFVAGVEECDAQLVKDAYTFLCGYSAEGGQS